MKIIFIRHGEPNYEIDSLTEKGWREAELLSKRTAKWNVTDFYCSPLGRAKDTASFTLKNAGREAEILPWLREFDAPVLDLDATTQHAHEVHDDVGLEDARVVLLEAVEDLASDWHDALELRVA